MQQNFHSYHLVDRSPWPFAASAGVLSLVLGLVGYMNRISFGLPSLCWGLAFVFFVSALWLRDVSREGSYLLSHGPVVKELLLSGFALFIISEMMLFLSFFWALFHVRLEGGDVLLIADWPMPGLVAVGSDGIPLLNTLILVTSGGFATLGHWLVSGPFAAPDGEFPSGDDARQFEPVRYHIWRSPVRRRVRTYLRYRWRDRCLSYLSRASTFSSSLLGSRALAVTNPIGGPKSRAGFVRRLFRPDCSQSDSLVLLLASVGLGFIFLLLQLLEYVSAPFSISDGSYGSAFFILTGFHGAHVFAGGVFLLSSAWRLGSGQLHIHRDSAGLECAVWYWHFVDLIWLYLFAAIYLE